MVKPLAVSMGEPAGIAPEIVLRAHLALQNETRFFVVGDAGLLDATATRLGLNITCYNMLDAADMPSDTRLLPVLKVPVPLAAPVIPGTLNTANAPAVVSSIDAALSAVQQGFASALVTCPIHKGTLYAAGFRHDGHTEYLAERTFAPLPVMLLTSEAINPPLRVVPLTIHKPLRDVAELIAPHRIIAAVKVLDAALRLDFGIKTPRIAVAALNPHAGEGGAMGDEEIRCIQPALKALQEQGFHVTGAHAADTLFHSEARTRYDAALCMYHDQALIPLKTLDFWGGVNVTLGLPVVRTSPDHGTALALAQSGAGANPDSLIAALRLAATLAARRADPHASH